MAESKPRTRSGLGTRLGTRLGVRVRVLATVLTLTAAGMALAGTITVLAELSQHRQHVDRTLQADVDEFRALAKREKATDGKPITDVNALMRTALQLQLASQGESFFATVGRTRLLPPGDRPLKADDLPEVMAAVWATTSGDQVRIQEVQTSTGPMRVAVVPTLVVGDPRVGRYVISYPMRPGEQQVLANARIYALVSGLCLALVGLVGWLVAGRLLRPLRLLRTAAEHISHSDLSLRIPISGHDDVSELTRTVNAMLDRLQAAFEAQQHFLDDAGHELRTPLTIVQGHLEVLDAADPAEVSDVRALVLDELDRMRRLVDDLIVLAKARRPDFLRPGPIDLDRLIDEVCDKAAALGPRRWRADGRPGICIVADAQRLTQALLQLADNAVRHTGPQDEIGIGASVDHLGQLRMWVRDTGVGVRPQDAERIFERFGRAGQGRGHDGSGLGLSIVSAIAAAHGGQVLLDSSPGHGATFVLVLPPARTLPPGRPDTPSQPATAPPPPLRRQPAPSQPIGPDRSGPIPGPDDAGPDDAGPDLVTTPEVSE